MKVIRATRGIYVPRDPENSKSALTFVQTGMIALVPEDFKIPKETYVDMGKLKLEKEKKSKTAEA